MTLADFVNRIKLQVPNIGQTGVTDAYLKTLINSSVDAVNAICKVYTGYTDFNIEAEKRTYDLSISVPTYLGRDKRGLFLKNSSDKWEDVTPKTEAWLAETHPDYLDATSVAIPEYYFIQGDVLGFYPPPSTDKTNGARLYHLKKANQMTADTHCPFSGTTTEMSAFTPLNDAMIAWCRWKLIPAYGAVTDQDLRWREFLQECKNGASQIKRAPDIMHDSSTRMRT